MESPPQQELELNTAIVTENNSQSIAAPKTASEPFVVGAVHMGVVKRYNPGRGFGFITGDNGFDIFLHQSKIVKEGFRCVGVGDVVRFSVAMTHPSMFPTPTVEAANVSIIHSQEASQAPGQQPERAGLPTQFKHLLPANAAQQRPPHHQQRQYPFAPSHPHHSAPQQPHHFHHQQFHQQFQQPFHQSYAQFPHQGMMMPAGYMPHGQQQQPTYIVIQAPSQPPMEQIFVMDPTALQQFQQPSAGPWGQPQVIGLPQNALSVAPNGPGVWHN